VRPDPGSGSRRLTVWPDAVDYWSAYVASLAAGSTTPVPVLSAHPELTAALLHEHGYALDPPDRSGAEFRSLGAALAAADDDIERLVSMEARLREIAGVGRRDDGAAIVGVGAMAKLGLLRAVADGRPFSAVAGLRDVCAATARSLYVTVAHVGADEPVALQQRVDAEARAEILPGVAACPVGYLTGRDEPMMTWLDAKQRLARLSGEQGDAKAVDLLIDCTIAAPPADLAEGLAAVPYRATGRETLAGHERIALLAVTSHGMSDLVHLNDDYICGASRYLGMQTPAGPLPSCRMAEGPLCFFKPAGRPIAGHEIPADHILVNSCGSLRFDHGDFDPMFAIWYAALEGRARSYVGSVRWKDGHGLEGLLYRHLLRRGTPLGTAVALLNRALLGNQIEGDGVYVLLGDPDERLTPAPAPVPPPRWEKGSPVRLRDGWAHVSVESPRLLRAFAGGDLLVSPGNTGLHSSMVRTDDGARLHAFLFGYQGLIGDVDVDIDDFGAELARVRGVADALAETLDPVLGMHGLYPDQVRQGRRKNLEARLLQIARLARQRFTEPATADKLRRAYRRLLREADQVDAEIATWMQERIRTTSYRFSEHYQEAFVLAEVGVSGTCHLCGRQLRERRLRHALRPAVRRTELLCHVCGGIADTPEPRVLVRVRLDQRQRAGTGAPVTVELVNRTGEIRQGYCLAAVRRSAQYRIGQPDPVRPVTVGPDEVASVAFHFDWDPAMPDHQYDLQVAFVAQTRLYLGRREFWLSR
jgi:hypothetical protein